MNARMIRIPIATLSWLTLVGLTLLTFLLGVLGYEGGLLVLAVLLIAIVKGQLIVDQFMLLRTGAPMWRMLLTGYLVTIGVLIASAFVFAG